MGCKVCVCVCVRACVRVCVRVCVRACVGECVHMRVHTNGRHSLRQLFSSRFSFCHGRPCRLRSRVRVRAYPSKAYLRNDDGTPRGTVNIFVIGQINLANGAWATITHV
jgi:hypothetical protein